MVLSDFRRVPPDHAMVPVASIRNIAKIVDAILTIEGQLAALDVKRAMMIADLYTETKILITQTKL